MIINTCTSEDGWHDWEIVENNGKTIYQCRCCGQKHEREENE